MSALTPLHSAASLESRPEQAPPLRPPALYISDTDSSDKDPEDDTEEQYVQQILRRRRRMSSVSDNVDDISSDDSGSDTSAYQSLSSESDFEDLPPLVNLSHPPILVRQPINSAEQAFAVVQRFAFEHDFAIKKTASKMGRKGFETMHLACSKARAGGTHRKGYDEIRKRAITSHLHNCPFLIFAKNKAGKDDQGVPKEQDWHFETRNNTHNHPPSDPIDLAVHRQESLTEEARTFIINLVEQRAAPHVIKEALLRAHPGVLIKVKDISNMAYRHRFHRRQGHTSTEAIVRRLQDEGQLARAFVNEAGACLGIIYSTKTARALTHRFPSIIFIDATYKTNRFGLPMIHICGFTSTNHSFSSAVVFVLRETQEWYELALKSYLEIVQVAPSSIKVVLTDRDKALRKALEKVLPDSRHQLCLWHILENIRGYTAKYFREIQQQELLDPNGNKEYDWIKESRNFRRNWLINVVNAPRKELIASGMAHLRTAFPHPLLEEAHVYLEKLLSLRKQFLACYIDRYRNFGQRTTSRLEGTHRAMKQYLKQPNDDLFEVLWGLEGFFQEQYTKLMDIMGLQREHVSIDVGSLFIEVKALVSRHAIELVKRQVGLAKRQISLESQNLPILGCTKTFKRSHGLPCSHTIKKLILTNDRLTIRHFHTQWRLSSRREIEGWIEEYESCSTGVDTRELIVPPRYDFNVHRDGEVILDPPRRPPPPSRKKQRRSHVSQAATQSGTQASVVELVPETQPSGRMSTSAEIRAGPSKPRPKEMICGACGKRGHNARNNLCPVRLGLARDQRGTDLPALSLLDQNAGNGHSQPGTVAQSVRNADMTAQIHESGYSQEFEGIEDVHEPEGIGLFFDPVTQEELDLHALINANDELLPEGF